MTPRWSPDGKYLAFLSARAPDERPRYGCSTGEVAKRDS